MGNYKNCFKKFLEENGFLPLSRSLGRWNCFEIEHGKKAIFKNNLVKIRKQVNEKSGIYAHKKGNKVLYIGKAVSLFGRIKSHNRASFESVPGDTKWNTWHKFFSSKKGKVHIYWKEIKIEDERVIVEKMLQYVLKPEFEIFRKKLEGKVKNERIYRF